MCFGAFPIFALGSGGRSLIHALLPQGFRRHEASPAAFVCPIFRSSDTSTKRLTIRIIRIEVPFASLKFQDEAPISELPRAVVGGGANGFCQRVQVPLE